MKHMGNYEILSHVEMPECSIRIIGMKEAEHVGLHYHEKCAQIYTVLEQEVEVRVGDRTMRRRQVEPSEGGHSNVATLHKGPQA